MDPKTDPDQIPLKLPLPSPPLVTIGGIAYVLEYVRIDRLDAWKREHGLVEDRRAFLGKPGWRPTVDGSMRLAGLGSVMLYKKEDDHAI